MTSDCAMQLDFPESFIVQIAEHLDIPVHALAPQREAMQNFVMKCVLSEIEVDEDSLIVDNVVDQFQILMQLRSISTDVQAIKKRVMPDDNV